VRPAKNYSQLTHPMPVFHSFPRSLSLPFVFS
jgi:hypothetical protein